MERTSNAKPKPRQVNGVFHKYSTTMVVLLLLLARRSSANNRKKRTKKWCWVNPLFGGLVGCVVGGGGWFPPSLMLFACVCVASIRVRASG